MEADPRISLIRKTVEALVRSVALRFVVYRVIPYSTAAYRLREWVGGGEYNSLMHHLSYTTAV